MSQYTVGKEVLSFCKRCKLVLAHLIVVMKGPDVIGKVMCKTCQVTHAHKDPGSTVVKGRTASGKSFTRTKSVPVAELWQAAVEQNPGPSQDYSIKSCFKVGDLIDHPSFGQGVIERTMDNDKIMVLFRADRKTLIHNKS